MLLIAIVFLPFLAGILTAVCGRSTGGGGPAGGGSLVSGARGRELVVCTCAFAELLLCLLLPMTMQSAEIRGVLVGGLSFTTDGFRAVYAIITAVMWLGTSLFSKEYFLHERAHLGRYLFFMIVTLGATEGVMLSADFMTAFVFFEILSFTSFTWVIHEETEEAVKAGNTYLFIALIGGLILFMGLLLLQSETGTLNFAELSEAVQNAPHRGRVMAAGVCILLGFGAKAGMFPLHVWLPKAHPVAPSPASALLSGILTKVGVYGILMTALHVMYAEAAFGILVLVLGEITMFLGAVLALFSINLKRTLACSSMSQIGFILTGTGMYVLMTSVGAKEEAETALSGLMLHMVNHSLIKLTLFMAAGVVVMNLHTLVLDDIRGWGRNKRALGIAFALGALGISGVPVFNGYISKTLLHEGIVEGTHVLHSMGGMLRCAEWIFLISGGFTFAYMLKLFICIFIEKNHNSRLQRQYDGDRTCMNVLSTVVIVGSSLAVVIFGQPAVMKPLAAFMTGSEEILRFSAFTLENLKGSMISLGIGALVYIVVVRRVLLRKDSYVNLWPAKCDLEEGVYRPVLTRLLPAGFGSAAAVFGENKILTPIAKGILRAASFTALALSDSLDILIVLLRKTAMKQMRVRHVDRERVGFWAEAKEVTQEAIAPLTKNFSFALMMTCIGILLILSVLVLLTVLPA